jgi:hypothetical protein
VSYGSSRWDLDLDLEFDFEDLKRNLPVAGRVYPLSLSALGSSGDPCGSGPFSAAFAVSMACFHYKECVGIRLG